MCVRPGRAGTQRLPLADDKGTARDGALPALYAERARPSASSTLVRTPSGGELDVADSALAAELGPAVRVIKQDRGVFDTLPLSLLTTQTLAGLGRLVGTGLAAGRFRPNLLVDAVGLNRGTGPGRGGRPRRTRTMSRATRSPSARLDR